jgi:DNA-binding NarL/FixJ family response regulator
VRAIGREATDSSRALPRPNPDPTPAPSKIKRRRRVLAIDDSEIILGRLKTVLEAEGIDVITTTRTVGNARYLVDCDLVIVDWHMPGLDGGSVVASLKAAASGLGHPVLFYLYTQDPAVARSFARLGFDGCITAKGDDRELVRQVHAAFRVLQLRALKR